MSGRREFCVSVPSSIFFLNKYDNRERLWHIPDEFSLPDIYLFLFFFLQDLSFPSPLESALIMGHLCACSDGLPIYGVDLRELGIRVVQWAQRFAQTCTDLKAIRRIDRMHNSNSKIM